MSNSLILREILSPLEGLFESVKKLLTISNQTKLTSF